LPCEKDSAIFVIYDESRLNRMQALISGPVDTPYEHGLYLFDIQFPDTYPEEPPIVKILTTGEG